MSVAPLQYLVSEFNPLVLVAADNLTDQYVLDAAYTGTTGTTPSDLYFAKACVLKHLTDGTLYQNTATSGTTPTWVLIAAGGSGITQLTGDVTAGPGTGSQVASIAAGVIVNADVNASAAIEFSKLAALTAGNILVGSAGNVATDTTMTGDATINPVGALNVQGFYGVALDGTTMATPNLDNIVQFDGTNWKAVAPSFAPLALPSANIFVGSGLGAATATAVTGDAAITNAGVVTVTDLTITGEATGDILYFNGTNWVKLAIGTAGQVLTVNGGGTAPVWA